MINVRLENEMLGLNGSFAHCSSWSQKVKTKCLIYAQCHEWWYDAVPQCQRYAPAFIALCDEGWFTLSELIAI